MVRVKIDVTNPSEEALELALDTIMKEGVVAHPTDTCYGLAADIYSKKALKKLYQIKQMRREKPVTFMVSSIRQAIDYAVFSEKALEIAKQCWPGPLTLVLERREAVPDYFNEYATTVGIRIPGDSFTFKLIERVGKPLTTTSVNITGQPAAYSAEEVINYFAKEQYRPDLLIDGGILEKRPTSTVIQVVGEEIIVLRQGDIRV